MRIQKGDPISIEFMFAIKLYTDYDKLQHALKKCLRIDDEYDDDGQAEAMNDLGYLYWWRNLLSIAVSKYGIKMKKHKFFYGCSQRMAFDSFGGFGTFNGPLSMTISLEVAKQFGMLLCLPTSTTLSLVI